MRDHEQLSQGLSALNIQYDETMCQKILQYKGLLLKWNQTFNLVSQHDTPQLMGRHILDSCSLHLFLKGHSILDVGTGPGLPGLLLAILSPALPFTLLDSSAKPIQFVRHAVSELSLNNVTVVQSRAEDFHPSVKFDTIVTRAFAPISVMLSKTQHLCAENSCFLAMKGKYPQEEIEAMPENYHISAVFPLQIPFSVGQRHIVRIEHSKEIV